MDIYLNSYYTCPFLLLLLHCRFFVLLRHLSTVELVSRWNWRVWHADRRPWNSSTKYVVVLIRCTTCFFRLLPFRLSADSGSQLFIDLQMKDLSLLCDEKWLTKENKWGLTMTSWKFCFLITWTIQSAD